MGRELLYRVCAVMVAVVLAVAAVYGVCWLAWKGALLVPANTARVAMLAEAALLPLAVFATWRLALRYVSGVVTGIGTGVGAVSEAGARAADLRVHVHRELKRPPDQLVVLPDVQIIERQLASGKTVEL